MSQCLWSLAISLKKQPGEQEMCIRFLFNLKCGQNKALCLPNFNMHFIGRRDMETSQCSLTMECGPSCNLLPLSST